MKKLNMLFLLLSFFACEQQEEIVIRPASDLKLKTIEINMPEQSWSEAYSYNSQKQLVLVEDLVQFGRRYELIYDKDLLQEIRTFDGQNDQFSVQQVIEYNEQNQITKVLSYNSSAELRIFYEYTYDDNGRLEKRILYSNQEEKIRTLTYEWKNGNITKIKTFAANDMLTTETFFEYDTERNYQQFRFHLIHDIDWRSQNNAVYTESKYHNGAWADSICPCTTDIDAYNEDGFPTSFTFNERAIYQLIYE